MSKMSQLQMELEECAAYLGFRNLNEALKAGWVPNYTNGKLEEGEKMKKMKNIYVTDPCYLISDRDWDKICAQAQEEGTFGEWFDKAVTEKLREISGDKCAVAGPTGFGDWENFIGGDYFGADSGMVCVVEETPELDEYLDDNGITFGFNRVARLNVPKMGTYEIDQSNPEWSVVKIKHTGKVIAKSF